MYWYRWSYYKMVLYENSDCNSNVTITLIPTVTYVVETGSRIPCEGTFSATDSSSSKTIWTEIKYRDHVCQNSFIHLIFFKVLISAYVIILLFLWIPYHHPCMCAFFFTFVSNITWTFHIWKARSTAYPGILCNDTSWTFLSIRPIFGRRPSWEFTDRFVAICLTHMMPTRLLLAGSIVDIMLHNGSRSSWLQAKSRVQTTTVKPFWADTYRKPAPVSTFGQ
jgi:hypothetical protein